MLKQRLVELSPQASRWRATEYVREASQALDQCKCHFSRWVLMCNVVEKLNKICISYSNIILHIVISQAPVLPNSIVPRRASKAVRHTDAGSGSGRMVCPICHVIFQLLWIGVFHCGLSHFTYLFITIRFEVEKFIHISILSGAAGTERSLP